MCGIIGFFGPNAVEKVKEGLKTLEYRGYDSAGIAWVEEGQLFVKKDVGYVEHVLKDVKAEAQLAIGHTRWATHGKVSANNAHPHTDCKNTIAVVHNGVLTNYAQIKAKLKEKGHVFKSDTDTEVIAHLIEEELKTTPDFKEAFKRGVKQLRGSYAILAISKEGNILAFARNQSPLIVGKGKEGIGVASDVNALTWANAFWFLEDGDIGFVSNGQVEGPAKWEMRSISLVETSKKGFPHFMLKEIYEQKELDTKVQGIEPLATFLEKIDKEELDIIACGTSYHAGLYLSYLLRRKGKKANAYIASEYRFLKPPAPYVLAISQSGETADVLRAVEYAKGKGCKEIHAVINAPNTTLHRLADNVSEMGAGPEFGVAATKTFLAQLRLFLRANNISLPISNAVEQALEYEEKIKELAKELAKVEHVFYIGRGLSYPLAMEGALKFKEITYIHAEAYPGGELKHGPISLIEEGVWVVAITPGDETREYMEGNIEEVSSRGAKVISIGEVKGDIDIKLDDNMFPYAHTVVLQLLAYHTSVYKGLNPDKPRNLAKSVTVE